MKVVTLQRTAISINGYCDRDDDNKNIKGNDDNDAIIFEEENELRLIFLGCEVLPPYGPCTHTAELFLDLIAVAASNCLRPNHQRKIVLDVFSVSPTTTSQHNLDGDDDDEHIPETAKFPTEKDLNRTNGVILPGSFSSAYDQKKPWIVMLKDWIQNVLVALEIPTFGVCFGHQLYAHSFNNKEFGGSRGSSGGSAVKCPAGPQAGRRTSQLTKAGRAFWAASRKMKIKHHGDNTREQNILNNKNNSSNIDKDDAPDLSKKPTITTLDLFYTHGDMVESLPSRGVNLGGNDKVPIQAAVYFSTPLVYTDDILDFMLASNNDEDDTRTNSANSSNPRVIAVTFQAHPEFASLLSSSSSPIKGGKEKIIIPTKGNITYRNMLQLMKDSGDISEQDYQNVEKDSIINYDRIREQSVNTMISAGRLLNWFSSSSTTTSL
jgi:GMP synthase-like glutamine amidotransferase